MSILDQSISIYNKKTLVVVMNGPSQGNFIYKNDIDKFIRSGVSILFYRETDLNAQIAYDGTIMELQPSAVNHSGRKDEDFCFHQGQQISKALIKQLFNYLPNSFCKELQSFQETIALSSGDYYAHLLMVYREISTQIEENGFTSVVLLGSDERNCMGLKALLERDGIVVHTSKIHNPKKLYAFAKRCARKIIRYFIAILEKIELALFSKSRLRTILNRKISKRSSPHTITNLTGLSYETMAELIGSSMYCGGRLCVVSGNDMNYLESISEVIKGTHQTINVILIANGLSSSARAVLTSNGKFGTDKLRIFTMIPADFNSLSFGDKNELKATIDAWVETQITQVQIDGISDFPIEFVLSGIPQIQNRIKIALGAGRIFSPLLKKALPNSLLLSPQRLFYARLIGDVARKHAFPTFDMGVGTIAYSRRQWKTNCDYVLVPDTRAFEIHTKFFGLPEHRVHIIGSPKIDKSSASIPSKIKKESQKHRMFLALQHLDLELNREMIKCCAYAAKQIGGKLCVGIHPKEIEYKRIALEEYCLSLGPHVELKSKPSLVEIAESEFCVTAFSFIAIEAFALNKKVIALNLTDKEWPTRLSHIGIAKEIRSVEALIRHLQTSDNNSTGDSRNDVLCVGKSVERLTQLMDRLPTTLNDDPPPVK